MRTCPYAASMRGRGLLRGILLMLHMCPCYAASMRCRAVE